MPAARVDEGSDHRASWGQGVSLTSGIRQGLLAGSLAYGFALALFALSALAMDASTGGVLEFLAADFLWGSLSFWLIHPGATRGFIPVLFSGPMLVVFGCLLVILPLFGRRTASEIDPESRLVAGVQGATIALGYFAVIVASTFLASVAAGSGIGGGSYSILRIWLAAGILTPALLGGLGGLTVGIGGGSQRRGSAAWHSGRSGREHTGADGPATAASRRPETEQVECPGCDEELRGWRSYCPECGTDLE